MLILCQISSWPKEPTALDFVPAAISASIAGHKFSQGVCCDSRALLATRFFSWKCCESPNGSQKDPSLYQVRAGLTENLKQ